LLNSRTPSLGLSRSGEWQNKRTHLKKIGRGFDPALDAVHTSPQDIAQVTLVTEILTRNQRVVKELGGEVKLRIETSGGE
jgi:hypothetical protein